MTRNVLITPANGIVEFQKSGVLKAKIELDTANNLIISSFGGDLVIGDITNDLYIGDGVNSVDIIFEQNGAVRALSGKTLTLGQSDSFVRVNSQLQITNNTLVANLNADLLDSQEGSYYLDWTNTTNKPDPVVTVTLTGDVTGTASTTLTDLTSNTVTVSTTIAANSVALGTDTTGNYVATITGTANQVTVSGSGSETAAVTLSLPQNIHTAATPTFSRLTLSQTTGTSPLTISSTTLVANLNSDLLDGQQGTYYLDWINVTNKPDPVVTVTLNGDVSGTASATLADLASNTITITTTVSDNSHNHSIANVSGLQSSLDGKYDKTGGTISGDVQISGNLIVVGSTVTHSANDFIVNDPIILIANNNIGNIIDLGFVAHYEDGGANTKHTGLIRDVSTNTWYLFEGYEPHVQETNILNIAHPTLATSNLKANLFGNANTSTTWQTARTITIGSTGKSIDGSAAVTWTLSEIGAQTAGVYVTTTTNQTISGIKTFTNNFIVTSNTVIANLNSDLLDGQHGSYYLDWTNVTNKPDPVVTVTLTGDVTGTANTTLTDLTSGTVSIATTIALNSVALGTDTTGNYVATITGTANQVTVSGSGSETAAVTLSLPQNIHTAATPTFFSLNLSSTAATTTNNTGALVVAGGVAVKGNVALTRILFADGTSMNTAASGTGGGASIVWTKKTANYTAVNGDRIIADTTAGSFIITLPSSPSTGDVIVIADGNSWSANTLNVARNGATIEGFSEDLQLDIAGIRVDLVYDGATWEVYTFATPQTSINNDNSTDTNQYPTMTRLTSGSLVTSYVSSTKLYFNPSSGALNATDFNSLSDATLKEEVIDIPNAMNIIDSIRPVEFKWKDNNKKSYGVIAQEIEKILPEIVSTNQDTNLKSVSYVQLIPLLLEAIKELNEEVKSLKKRKK